ncbi:hypothetical protein [Alkaliphilus transvaalensis]|uniref:hypothetical protein n=1 Tax=Alkaliphilus transvaalensis TaxID=114628 RepID=UPI00047ABCE9|nr:hypothetical protein [Alkaliphilus transvaalensis]
MKKIFVIILIGSILFFPIREWYGRITMPNKVLVVGEQVGEFAIKFNKEVREEKKIAQYERILGELIFEESEWVPETYPEFVLKIVHKEGYFIGFHHIWINEEGGTLLIPNGSDRNYAKLTTNQVKELEEIIEY